jgi:adenosylcobyric acid synthase
MPLFEVGERNGRPTGDDDGCVSPDLKCMGTYIHGMFENSAITQFWLQDIGLGDIEVSQLEGLEARNKEYDLLADHFEKYVNIERIMKLVQ